MLASEPFDDDEDWQEIPDRHLVTVRGSRVEMIALKGSCMTLSLSNHLAADSAARALRRDVLRRPHPDTEVIAAQVVL